MFLHFLYITLAQNFVSLTLTSCSSLIMLIMSRTCCRFSKPIAFVKLLKWRNTKGINKGSKLWHKAETKDVLSIQFGHAHNVKDLLIVLIILKKLVTLVKLKNSMRSYLTVFFMYSFLHVYV